MEKKQKKSKLLLWILLCAAFVAAAVVAVVMLTCSEDTDQQKSTGLESKIYLNVERDRYVAQGYYGVSSRIPDSDGYYRINMAVDGEQIQVLVSDVNLVNRIDFKQLMGLTFDENGVVNGILELDEFTGGVAADKFVVVSVLGNTVVCNTSPKYKGIDIPFEINEDTKIWQIGDFEAMMGLPTYIAEGDQVILIRDKAGNISDVYVFPFVPPGDVYWNLTRMYDTEAQVSTRERDSLGYFVYDFVVNGESKILRTRDQAVADLIDKHASQAMGLVFDENGDIIEVLNAGNVVCGGGLLCNRYAVTEINGSDFTVKLGTTSYTASLSKDCKYFDVSGSADYLGEPVDGIQVGDKVTVLLDRKGQVCVIYITNRLTENDIYWVVERKQVWNRTTWTTNRKPAADGWYYIKLAGNGKQITAKTKNAELVNQLDSFVCWCVELDGDRIVGIQDATNRYGGSTFGTFHELIKIDGKTLSVQKPSSVLTANMADDCQIYNVSTSAITMGEPTTVRKGDTIYGFMDLEGNIRYIFVTATTFNGKLYWNTQRLYDDTAKHTTRQRAADGYYHFEMICEGETLWLKTSSKEIANKIDLVKTRVRGLKLSGDIILDVLAPENLTNYQGVKPDIGWKTVTAVDGNAITINDNGTSRSFTMAAGCKVYNMTSAFVDYKGEPTTVREGDTIVALLNSAKKAVCVYVCGNRTRTFQISKQECPCADKVTWQPWDGTTELTGGYYRLTQDIVAPEGGFVITGATVNLRLDGHTITASNGPAFVAASNAIVSICDHDTRGAILGAGDGRELSGVFSVENSNSIVRMYNIDLYAVGGTANNGAVIGVRGWLSLYNVNVYGGQAARKGGNIAILPSGGLQMYGGSLKDGTATIEGDNLFVAGSAYLEDVSISGGVVASVADKVFIINGARITGGETGLTLQSGHVTLAGTVIIDENTQNNLYLAQDTAVVLDQLAEDSVIKISSAATGVFCEEATQAEANAFESNDPNLKVVFTDGKLLLHSEHMHCICKDYAGHDCTQQAWVGLTQADILSGNYSMDAGSYYYLKEDVQLSSHLMVGSLKTLNLCLNGHTITAPAAARIFVVSGGTLNLTDCGETGSLAATKGTTGAAILVQGNGGGANGDYMGTFNLYAGTISGGAASQGGTVAVTGGTMNMYGGTLRGGTATKSGGTLYVEKGQNLNLYGGQITSGTAAVGACLYADAETNITLNGIEVLEAVYLNGTQLVVESLPDSFTTQINAAASGVLIQNIEEADAAKFTTVSEKTLNYDLVAKTLSITLPVIAEHSHCICGGLEGHSCSMVEWTGLTQADMLTGSFTATADHYYYLTENVQLTAPITLSGPDTVLNLCLNEFALTAPANNRAFVINGATLNLTACQDSGKVVGGQYTKNGGMVYIQGVSGNKGEKGQLNLYGGTLQGGTAGNGGVVYISWGSMSVYGGTVQGATVTNAAAAIWVNNGQSLSLFGGQILSGTGAKKGNCVLAMQDSVITVGGNAQVDEIYLNKAGLQLQVSSQYPLTDTARIGVQMLTPGVVMDLEEYLEGTFICRNAGMELYWDPETKKLTMVESVSDIAEQDEQ